MDIRIEHVEIFGLDKALIASGNPMRTEMDDNRLTATESDEKRGLLLAKTALGTGHDNWLQGVIVQADFYAPLYWWKQAQRYHWFDFISSQSTMHRALKFNLAENCNQYVDPRVITILEELKAEYEALELPEEKKIVWYRFISNIPSGFILGATMTTNYRQLKTMYLQRKHHKLEEWDYFCKWCEMLPLFKEMVGIE